MPRFRLARLGTAMAAIAGLAAMPLLLEARLARPARQVDDSWKRSPITPRSQTLLGFSFRPRQIEAFGLDAHATLDVLLAQPFSVVRLPAYWNQIEPSVGKFDTSELDWQLEAVERAGKRVIMSVGAIKNFGYPEFFVPRHQLGQSLPEGSLVRSSTHAALLPGAQRSIQKGGKR